MLFHLETWLDVSLDFTHLLSLFLLLINLGIVKLYFFRFSMFTQLVTWMQHDNIRASHSED